MANVKRIFDAVVSGRVQISFSDFERLLRGLGFQLDRVGGSHHVYVHPKVPLFANIQRDGKDAKPYQVRQVRDMIREFGLSLEE